MEYEKPELTILGSTNAIVLGSSNSGNSDQSGESNHRRAEDIEDGLDD